MRGQLATDEIERAAHYIRARDRLHYVVRHFLLRCVLGRYVGRTPAALRFTCGAAGKPMLMPDRHTPDLRFNLSFSEPVLVIAVALGREVGVDVERRRPVPRAESIAERYFSEEERRRLHARSGAHRQRCFFDFWTCKEAAAKAVGRGLTASLGGIDGSALDCNTKASLCLRGLGPSRSDWTMARIAVGSGYSATLVAEGSDWRLRRWRLPRPAAAALVRPSAVRL